MTPQPSSPDGSHGEQKLKKTDTSPQREAVAQIMDGERANGEDLWYRFYRIENMTMALTPELRDQITEALELEPETVGAMDDHSFTVEVGTILGYYDSEFSG